MPKLSFDRAQLTARLLTNSFWTGAEILTKNLLGSSPAGPLVSASLGVVKSTFGDTLSKSLTKRLALPEEPPEVRDLHRAIGVALRAALEGVESLESRVESRESRVESEGLDALAKAAPGFWSRLAESERSVLADEVTDYFATRADEIGTVAALSPSMWRTFLLALAEEVGIELPDPLLDTLAQTLHIDFPQALRQTLLDDQQGGGQSYSSLTLLLLGEITAILREGQEAGRQRHDELLTRLEQIQSTLQASALVEAPPLPTGTVTFLFTEIEGSTQLWDEDPAAMRAAIQGLSPPLLQAVQHHNGFPLQRTGDGFHAVFAHAVDALQAALEAQKRLLNHGGHGEHGERQEIQTTGDTGQASARRECLVVDKPFSVFSVPSVVHLKVRMALHTGPTQQSEQDYIGPTVHRTERLLGVCAGGQILLSRATAELVRPEMPEGAGLRELGLCRLKDLQRPEEVFQLLHPDLPDDFPPLRSLDNLPNNLPQQLTTFVGREEQIRTLVERLRLPGTARLVTLVGVGGTGKTRLALQVAAELLEGDADGVWFVELAPLSDPEHVAQAVASVLGMREETGKPILQTLASSLKENLLLLVMDNCEHLLDACAKLADTLLRQCPGVHVLATSREPLGIPGEQIYRVPSLALPDPSSLPPPAELAQYEAIQLFVERAAVGKPDFMVTEANAACLARLCHRLDGIPLALELAAARVLALPLEQLEARLNDRFRLLTGGSRAAMPRQQTLRAMIDWSYDLLNDQDKMLLNRLSVFAGGWTLDAAEAVVSEEVNTPSQSKIQNLKSKIERWDILDLLTSLTDKSLVVYEEALEGEPRYRMLETVRQYAEDRLREDRDNDVWREKHITYFLALAQEADPELAGSSPRTWLERLEREHDNIRAALDWGCRSPNGAENSLRLTLALRRLWQYHGHLSEARNQLERALAAGRDADPVVRAYALTDNGIFAQLQGDYGAARAALERSLESFRELGDQVGLAAALSNLGNTAYFQGDYAAARTFHEECLAIRRARGDDGGIATSLSNLGNLVYLEGGLGVARTFYEESITLYRKLGQRHALAGALCNLGNATYFQGDYAVARACQEECMEIYQTLGDRRGLSNALNNLGYLAHDHGDYDTARTLQEESLRIRREFKDRYGIVYSLDGLAMLASAEGAPLRAARLWGAAERLQEDIEFPIPLVERPRYEQKIAAARATVGDDIAFDAAWAEGHALSWEQAVTHAFERD